jgi:hypothetical protein
MGEREGQTGRIAELLGQILELKAELAGTRCQADRIDAELERVRVERDRLFARLVTHDQYYIRRDGDNLGEQHSAWRVLCWMLYWQLPAPDGVVAAALTEHDRTAAVTPTPTTAATPGRPG